MSSMKRGVRRRRGTMVPMVVVATVGLLAVVSLGVDLGVIAMARTQCQIAADSAALAGARALNGSRAGGVAAGEPITMADNNYAAAAPTALAAATGNRVLGKAVPAGDVNIVVGKYYYDVNESRFISYPAEPGSINDSRFNWSLVRASIETEGDVVFASAFGHSPYRISASATAVHRPRDVAIILDFSGSMRFGSLPGIPHGGSSTRKTNNPDTEYPRFGHYSVISASAMRQSQAYETISGSTFQATNTTVSHPLNNNRPPIIEDFYPSASSSAAPAFTSAGPGDGEGYVAGDRPPRTNVNGYTGGGTYARTVNEIFNVAGYSPTSQFDKTGGQGYDYLYALRGWGPFRGYTQGPGYWGKTFFLWPPDPRGATNTTTAAQHDNGAKDWRQRFFLFTNGTTPLNDNRRLWDSSSGHWKSPVTDGSAQYRINYRAILKWIQDDPNPFPAELHAGRICYYDRIPNPNDATLNTRFWNFNPSSPSGLDQSERFWKDYIDFVLGLSQIDTQTWDSVNSSIPNIIRVTGYGDDVNWSQASHLRITGKPSGQYMDYGDNPKRPITRFWFGPMSMVDFIGCYNMGIRDSYQRYCWMPGTAHEAPMYACKLGIMAALADIENNHPNDMVSLIFYSQPKRNSGDIGNRFNRVRVPLSREYQKMTDSLFYPPSTLLSYSPSNPARPYDADNMEVPRPSGGTSYAMGLMLAYNQFSGNTSLRTYNPSGLPGDAGGLGRRGAHKLVILETDGQPNVAATASLNVSRGPNMANYSYYRIRYNSASPGSSEYPTVNSYADNATQVTSQIEQIVSRMCALETDATPGFATPRKPVLVHCVAFGPFVEDSSPGRTAALETLQKIERIGKTQSSSTPHAWLPSYKIVTGDDDQVVEKLRKAISTIMQDGVQVSLIE